MYVCMHTERQNKLITSSEGHSLKSTASKLIIFGHRLAIVILIKHIYKINYFSQKGEKCREIARGKFFKKSQKLLASWPGNLPQTKAGTGVT